MAALPPVIGHEAALEPLLSAQRDGRLTHALLLSGPSGVGKTTAALALAAAALDGTGWSGPLSTHPDLWLEDGDAERIGIARIRAGGKGDDGPSLQDLMSLRTYAGGMRVAVIARADRLTEQAADALLKTLEEPPPATLIVLCASSPESLPETIVSRAQQVVLGTVEPGRVATWLEEGGIEPRLARLAAALSGGRPGRARRLASEPGRLAGEVGALHAFLAIGGSGTEGALRAAADLTPAAGVEGREQAMVLLAVWASFARDAVLEATGVPELRLWTEYADPLERWAQTLGAARLTDILGLLLRAGGEVARYAQPRLTFETLFLDIFAGAQPPPPVDPPADPVGLTDAPAAEAAGPAAAPRKRPARKR